MGELNCFKSASSCHPCSQWRPIPQADMLLSKCHLYTRSSSSLKRSTKITMESAFQKAAEDQSRRTVEMTHPEEDQKTLGLAAYFGLFLRSKWILFEQGGVSVGTSQRKTKYGTMKSRKPGSQGIFGSSFPGWMEIVLGTICWFRGVSRQVRTNRGEQEGYYELWHRLNCQIYHSNFNHPVVTHCRQERDVSGTYSSGLL